jgi:hypothetical protein
MHIWYKLDGHNAVPCDMMEGAASLARSVDDRRVAYTEIDDCRVSTVFLGIDHRFGDGPPLLFETMSFSDNDQLNGWCERATTWDDALLLHEKCVSWIQEVKDADGQHG